MENDTSNDSDKGIQGTRGNEEVVLKFRELCRWRLQSGATNSSNGIMQAVVTVFEGVIVE